MIFAVFDVLLTTYRRIAVNFCINCSFLHLYLTYLSNDPHT